MPSRTVADVVRLRSAEEIALARHHQVGAAAVARGVDSADDRSGYTRGLAHRELRRAGDLVRDCDLRRLELVPGASVRAAKVAQARRSRRRRERRRSCPAARHGRRSRSRSHRVRSRSARAIARADGRPRRRGRAGSRTACRAPWRSTRRRRPTRRRSHVGSLRSRAAAASGGSRLLSRRITSMCRGSPSAPASSRARSRRLDAASETTRPSTLDTAFCATTTTSPRSSPPARSAAAAMRPPRSSPCSSSGIPRTG